MFTYKCPTELNKQQNDNLLNTTLQKTHSINKYLYINKYYGNQSQTQN